MGFYSISWLHPSTSLKDQVSWIFGAILDVDGGFKLTAS